MNEGVLHSHTFCHECDLAVDLGDIPDGHKASCPRCNYVISYVHPNALDRTVIFVVTAALCLLFSGMFEFIEMSVQGQKRAITLIGTVTELLSLQQWALAAITFVVVIALPVAFVGVLSWLALSIKFNAISSRTIILLRIIEFLRFWNMAEIFFLGVLVSMVKIASMANLQMGISFWAYAMFNMFLIAAMMHMDEFQLALKIKRTVGQQTADGTGALSSQPAGKDGYNQTSKHDQLQRSWIYLITGLMFYIPANFLPIMVTTQFGQQTYNTIAGGVVVLWEHGSYLIAIIIFVASLFVPIAKFIALTGLCLCESLNVYPRPRSKVFIYRVTEFVGRWSMIDVFVVAFLTGLIQMGALMSVYPGPAALAFAGMVVFTMLAAKSLDPKMFWEEKDE